MLFIGCSASVIQIPNFYVPLSILSEDTTRYNSFPRDQQYRCIQAFHWRVTWPRRLWQEYDRRQLNISSFDSTVSVLLNESPAKAILTGSKQHLSRMTSLILELLICYCLDCSGKLPRDREKLLLNFIPVKHLKQMAFQRADSESTSTSESLKLVLSNSRPSPKCNVFLKASLQLARMSAM